MIEHNASGTLKELLATIDRAVVGIIGLTSCSEQAAIFLTLKVLYPTLTAQEQDSDAVDRLDLLRDIAERINYDVTGTRWTDGGTCAEDITCTELLDDISAERLGYSWRRILQNELEKTEYHRGDDLRKHWEGLRRQVEAWPTELRIDDQALVEVFLASMPHVLQQKCRTRYRENKRARGSVPGNKLYRMALESCQQIIQQEYGGTDTQAMERRIIESLKKEMLSQNPEDKKKGVSSAMLSAMLSAGHGELIASLTIGKAECRFCKDKGFTRFNHPAAQCFHAQNPDSNVPPVLRQLYKNPDAISTTCKLGSSTAIAASDLARQGIDTHELRGALTSATDVPGIERGSFLRCGCSVSEGKGFDFNLFNSCKVNRALITAMQKSASALGGHEEITDEYIAAAVQLQAGLIEESN